MPKAKSPSGQRILSHSIPSPLQDSSFSCPFKGSLNQHTLTQGENAPTQQFALAETPHETPHQRQPCTPREDSALQGGE